MGLEDVPLATNPILRAVVAVWEARPRRGWVPRGPRDRGGAQHAPRGAATMPRSQDDRARSGRSAGRVWRWQPTQPQRQRQAQAPIRVVEVRPDDLLDALQPVLQRVVVEEQLAGGEGRVA